MIVTVYRTEKELKEYNNAQVDEINRHKYIESEKQGFDVGIAFAAMDWIKLYGKLFHDNWFEQLKNNAKSK